MTKTKNKQIKILTYRQDDFPRTYANYVEITTTQQDINLKFCDVKPPENEEEAQMIEKDGKVYVPVKSEIVIPVAVAQELKRILNEKLS